MKFYAAPMEALTGYVFRNAQFRFYGGADRYFTPFLVGLNFSIRERNEVIPEHNIGMDTVPQILSNNAKEFLTMAGRLHRRFGYEEVNLNLGCPAAKVVAKHHGSGFLDVPDELDRFLDIIFEKCPTRISVKTRIGVNDAANWEKLLRIYDQYPISELIIHPRIRKQGYGGSPDPEAFALALRKSHHVLIYNGDIRNREDLARLLTRFPEASDRISERSEHSSGITGQSRGISGVMCGRGMISHPWIFNELRGLPYDDSPRTLFAFSQALHEDYCSIMPVERSVLCKMKELWNYFASSFPDCPTLLQDVRNCRTLAEYDRVMQELDRSLPNRPAVKAGDIPAR